MSSQVHPSDKIVTVRQKSYNALFPLVTTTIRRPFDCHSTEFLDYTIEHSPLVSLVIKASLTVIDAQVKL